MGKLMMRLAGWLGWQRKKRRERWSWSCEHNQVVGELHDEAPDVETLLDFLYSGRFPPKDARWQVSPLFAYHAMKLKDGRWPVWTYDIKGAEPDALLGYPVEVVNQGSSAAQLFIPIPPPNFETDLV